MTPNARPRCERWRGPVLATMFVLSMTWWIQSVAETRGLDLGWRITAVSRGR